MSVVPDTDRYADMNVELVCPKCGLAGLIPWLRLNHLLFCHGCSSTFRVEANRLVELEEPLQERILVQVRSSSSEWHDHKAIIEKAPSVARRLSYMLEGLTTSTRARWAAVCGAILLIVVSLATVGRGQERPPPLQIPTMLEERALLLTDSVARRDMEVLTRLTDPSQHRALRIWLAHGTGLPPRLSGENSNIKSEMLSTAKTTAVGDSVDVRVRLRMPPAGKEFVLDERWVRQGNQWYFRPARLRSPRPWHREGTGSNRAPAAERSLLVDSLALRSASTSKIA